MDVNDAMGNARVDISSSDWYNVACIFHADPEIRTIRQKRKR